MPIESHTETPGLRTALRELVALSTIPVAWLGRDPPIIAAGLADVLVGLLCLDFTFVCMRDPKGGAAIEVTRGQAWETFPEWLRTLLDNAGQFSSKEILTGPNGAEPLHVVIIPIGVNSENGLIAAACARTDFPSEIDQLLLSVATNHAATAFQNARLRAELDAKVAELHQARNELEIKVAERTAELRRSEAYLADAQTLTHTGSFGWRPSTGEIIWSEETFQIFQYDRTTKPTVELVLQRVYPEDAALVKQTIERASQDAKDFEHEHRLLMPDGSIKCVRVLAHASRDKSGGIEFVGAVSDVTPRRRAEEALRKSEERWRSVFENSAIGVALTDLNGRFVTTNHVFQTMTGYTEEELRALSFLDVTHEDYREGNWALITELLEGKRRQFQIEKKYRRKDGSLVWVSNNVSLVPGTERVPRFINGAVRGHHTAQTRRREAATD